MAAHLFEHYGQDGRDRLRLPQPDPHALTEVPALRRHAGDDAAVRDDALAMACLTPQQLCSAFRAATGRSVWRWMNGDIDEGRPPPPAACDVLFQVFGLTPAEARAARQVLEGGSTAAMAVRLGVSLNTFKSQLKAVYAKTATHRQTELLRLMSALGG